MMTRKAIRTTMDEQTTFFDPTAFDPELLAAVDKTGICLDYYSLCDKFPIRSSYASPKLPTKEIFQEASSRIALKKVKGPGRIFVVEDLPSSTLLAFILQGTTVETEISIQFNDNSVTTTFAILCNRVTQYTGGGHVLYPRPDVISLEELIQVFEHLKVIFIKLLTTYSSS